MTRGKTQKTIIENGDLPLRMGWFQGKWTVSEKNNGKLCNLLQLKPWNLGSRGFFFLKLQLKDVICFILRTWKIWWMLNWLLLPGRNIRWMSGAVALVIIRWLFGGMGIHWGCIYGCDKALDMDAGEKARVPADWWQVGQVEGIHAFALLAPSPREASHEEETTGLRASKKTHGLAAMFIFVNGLAEGGIDRNRIGLSQ